MGPATRAGEASKHEAAQRGRCTVAVQRGPHDPHAHAEDRHPRCVGPSGRVLLRPVPRGRDAPSHGAAPTALPTRRHPVQDAPPDVDRELRPRRRLSPAPGRGRGTRRSPRTRRAHRRTRVHPAGPQPSALGDVRRRGARGWPDRRHPQGAPRARGRGRVGQPARVGHPAGPTRPVGHRHPHRRRRAHHLRAAARRGSRPRPPNPQAAPTDGGDGPRGEGGPPSGQGTGQAPRTRVQLRAAVVVHQPRRDAGAALRDRAPAAAGRQGAGQDARRHPQRRRPRDRRRRASRTDAALRRCRGRTADRRGPGQLWQPRPLGGQRVQLPHALIGG